MGKLERRKPTPRELARVLELSKESYSARAIASSVGLHESTVREILDRVRA